MSHPITKAQPPQRQPATRPTCPHRTSRTHRPTLPLNAAQLDAATVAAEQARLPLGQWLERAALAVIGPTTLPGVRTGPTTFAPERASWLASVQAMREAALDIAFLAGRCSPSLPPTTRAGHAAVLLATCEEGLAEALRRSAAVALAAGTRARATGLPQPRSSRTARRIRVSFTTAEALLLRSSARVCGTTVGRFVATAAGHYAAALDPYTMSKHHARLAATVAVLQQERDHWNTVADVCLATGAAPPAWATTPNPPHLRAAAAGLRQILSDTSTHWSGLLR